MGPTPQEDEKVLPLLKKLRAVGDGGGISGFWIISVEKTSVLWTLNIIPPIKTEWAVEEDFNLTLRTISTKLVWYKSLRRIKFTPSENSKIPSGSYIPDREYDILHIIEPFFDLPHIEECEIYVFQFSNGAASHQAQIVPVAGVEGVSLLGPSSHGSYGKMDRK